jgi:hypothetical protein
VELTGPKNRLGGAVVGAWVVMEIDGGGVGGVGIAAGACTAARVGAAAAAAATAAAIGVDVNGVGRSAAPSRW